MSCHADTPQENRGTSLLLCMECRRIAFVQRLLNFCVAISLFPFQPLLRQNCSLSMLGCFVPWWNRNLNFMRAASRLGHRTYNAIYLPAFSLVKSRSSSGDPPTQSYRQMHAPFPQAHTQNDQQTKQTNDLHYSSHIFQVQGKRRGKEKYVSHYF